MFNRAAAVPPLALFDPMARWADSGEIEALPRSYRFGPFLLQPERQLLTRADAPVRIGGRALDILTALVERPGELVAKQELIARVWPNVLVDEANLKANMALLRRILGERPSAPRFIATVVGRGYRFVSPVRTFGSAVEIAAAGRHRHCQCAVMHPQLVENRL